MSPGPALMTTTLQTHQQQSQQQHHQQHQLQHQHQHQQPLQHPHQPKSNTVQQTGNYCSTLTVNISLYSKKKYTIIKVSSTFSK